MSIKNRSIAIQKSLGTRTAAGYLRNQGVSLRMTLFSLTGQRVVRS